MEATCAILRLDKKRVDDVKRVRLALASGEFALTDVEKNAILASAEALKISREYQEQELLQNIRQEGHGDPFCVMKMISSFISHLESQAARYQKAKASRPVSRGSKRTSWPR
jgi:hypothetical protein